MSELASAAAVARGATVTLLAGRAALPGGAARWERTNHRGSVVSLRSGPVLALAAVAGARLPLAAVAVAGLGAAAVGTYDDVAGLRAGQRADKGFAGHVRALRQGRVSAGAVKVAGIGLAALGGAALLPRRPPLDVLLAAGVVAGSANLVNLLDLRPGRALKAGSAAAAALGEPGVAAAAGLLLPGDLAERTMLGDCGANALGAVLGMSLAHRLARRGSGTCLAVLVALTAASEVVSFSQVIDVTPPLRWLDRLGRR